MSLHTVSFRLPAGESLSDPIDCTGYDAAIRLIMPDEWTGGAPVTFQLSPDNTTYHNLYHVIPDKMITYEVTLPRPVPGSVLTFPPGMGAYPQWVKVRSGTASVPVMQEADRTFTLVLEFADTTSGAT
jgi:hypothetical protein